MSCNHLSDCLRCGALVDDLEKDSERLEWLAKTGAKVYRRTEHSGYIVTTPCHEIMGKQDHTDWRDAIDEAMRGD